ncbi:hypothetical protein [Pseudarthrobacter sp. TAF60_1]|uniref:hypothetical protein n=1 Tax=Pseudarthrobacter sp. TAF60_1 TaxID=3233071 RepID=UPI003F943100
MTLGSLWQLFERATKQWMLGGTAAVLAGVTIGLGPTLGFGEAGFTEAGLSTSGVPGGGFPGQPSMELLMASLFLSLGGGYAVLFPGLRAGGDVHLLRDWKISPLSGRLFWALSFGTATAGLMACVLSATTHSAVPVAFVWLFMGPFLALNGWAAAVMGTAAAVRLADPSDAHSALATPTC